MNKEIKKYDFVVCGAGLSGIVAAAAAAREGAKVALINDRSVPGGNASSEIGVVIQGASHHGLNCSVYAKETGIIDEIRSRLDYLVTNCGYMVPAALDAVLFDFIYKEENIDMYLNTTVLTADTKDGKITAMTAYQMKEDRFIDFIAPFYADCTGDAVLAVKAGAETKMGSESKAEFNERSAPESPETFTMGNTLYFEIEDVGEPVPFVRPDFAYDITKMDFMKDIDKPENMRMIRVTGRMWTLEYGGQVNTITDNEHIHLELRKLIFGIWDYIKNSGKYPEAETMKIKRVHTIAGTRESRRIIGDYILTQNDIEALTKHYDDVCISGWPMDLHAPKGIYDTIPASAFIHVRALYGIPFRTLYSKNVSNLLMAGRNTSVSHIALSSTRVISTCASMGQAIGTAVPLMIKYNLDPRDFIVDHIDELKERLLYHDQSMIDWIETGDKDLEDKFKASVSSERAYENIKEDNLLNLTETYGIALPLKTETLESLSVKIKNLSFDNQKLRVRILNGEIKEAYLPDELVKEFTLDVEGGYDDFITLDINAEKGEDNKVYVVFMENENISLYTSCEKLCGAVTFRFYEEENKYFNYNTCPIDEKTGFIGEDILVEKHNIVFKDVLPEQNIYSADNLFNGYVRPYLHSNMWIAKGDKNEWVKLESDTFNFVKEIHLFFDHEIENDLRNKMPLATVKAYTVKLYMEDEVKTIEVKENYLRKNIIDVNGKINKVEILFNETYGYKYMSMYGIKLF